MDRPMSRYGLRKWPVLIVTALLLCIIATTSLTRAQETPPAPEPAAATAALIESLTPEQRKAVEAVLAKYEPELEAIAKTIPDPNSVSAEEYRSALQTAAPRLSAIQAQITAEIDAVLNTEQRALSQAAQKSVQRESTPPTAATTPGGAQSAETQATSVSGCFASAQRASSALAYAGVAKSYAYINAFNTLLGTNSSNAFRSYIYFNAAQTYALSGFEDLSKAVVLLTATDPLVQSVNGEGLFGVAGEQDMVTARDYAITAIANALADYINSGQGNYFAYISYLYGIDTRDYANDAVVLAGNCY